MTRKPLFRSSTPEDPLPDFSMNRQFLRGEGNGAMLRIGIICVGNTVPRYAKQILEDIDGSNFSRLTCVIEWPDDEKNALSSANEFLIRKNRSGLLYRCYKYITKAVKQPGTDPLDPVPHHHSNHEQPPGITTLRLSGSTPDAVEQMIEQVNAMQLDVIINFASPVLNKAFCTVAAHGLWFYRLGQDSVTGSGDDLVCMALDDASNTADIRLVRLHTDARKAAVLREARYTLSPTLSARKNRYAPYFGSSWFVIEKLAELYATGEVATLGTVNTSDAAPSPGPGNRQILRYLGRRLRSILSRTPSLLRHKETVVHWKIALRHSRYHLPEENESVALPQFRWLTSPAGHFWADPFLLEHEGKTWLFFEDYDRSRGKGHIACTTVDENGCTGDIKTVIEKPWHLSYPQVFSFEGEIYMVPESVEHQTVDLYRARRFPDDWVHEKQLLDVALVDATLHYHDGRWWMFASPMTIAGHAPVTCLWTADTLTGDWQLAPAHVVSHDVRYARNAGAISSRDGNCYRVSQDCSEEYGSALWFNRIVQWSRDHYVEVPEKRVEGRQILGLTGIHSYNRVGDIEVIDGRFKITLP